MSKLIVTPYIEAGKLEEARELAKVTKLPTIKKIESYSGFFTVDKNYDSNLFFWFFPTEMPSGKDAPVVLWIPGGPGCSALFGLFLENGPFSVSARLKLAPRPETWTKMYSMLYLDPTVGSGFSHTSSKEGYSKCRQDVAHNIYEALTQFFKLFPNLLLHGFWIAGESYGGKFATTLARKIHSENEKQEVVIKLKGLILGGAFLDPVRMVDGWGQHLYGMSLLDKKGKTSFDEKSVEIRKFVEEGKFQEAFDAQDRLVGGDNYKGGTLFHKLTGYDMYFNILEPGFTMDYFNYIQLLGEESMTSALHVGDATFRCDFGPIFNNFIEDYMQPVTRIFQELMDLNYQALLFVGQFDPIIPSHALEDMLENMYLNGFNDAVRKVWKVNGNVAGYVKQGENVTFAIVRNAGHSSPIQKPLECLELAANFTNGVRY